MMALRPLSGLPGSLPSDLLTASFLRADPLLSPPYPYPSLASLRVSPSLTSRPPPSAPPAAAKAIATVTRDGHITEARRRGFCKFFNATKGFGFIQDDQGDELPILPTDPGPDIFVHFTSILACDSPFKSLLDGEVVEYSLGRSSKGLAAIDVTGPHGVPVKGNPLARSMQESPSDPSAFWMSPMTLPLPISPASTSYLSSPAGLDPYVTHHPSKWVLGSVHRASPSSSPSYTDNGRVSHNASLASSMYALGNSPGSMRVFGLPPPATTQLQQQTSQESPPRSVTSLHHSTASTSVPNVHVSHPGLGVQQLNEPTSRISILEQQLSRASQLVDRRFSLPASCHNTDTIQQQQQHPTTTTSSSRSSQVWQFGTSCNKAVGSSLSSNSEEDDFTNLFRSTLALNQVNEPLRNKSFESGIFYESPWASIK